MKLETAGCMQGRTVSLSVEVSPELALLEDVPVEDIARTDSLLGEAVGRLRAGTVIRQAGYDGEYGVIRLFGDGELARFTKGGLLFDAPIQSRTRAARRVAPAASPETAPEPSSPTVPMAGQWKWNGTRISARKAGIFTPIAVRSGDCAWMLNIALWNTPSASAVC